MDKYNKSIQHQWFHHATWGDSKYKNEGVGKVLWHSLTEDGKVEIVKIKFGNKIYDNVNVKHLNPIDDLVKANQIMEEYNCSEILWVK